MRGWLYGILYYLCHGCTDWRNCYGGRDTDASLLTLQRKGASVCNQRNWDNRAFENNGYLEATSLFPGGSLLLVTDSSRGIVSISRRSLIIYLSANLYGRRAHTTLRPFTVLVVA